MSRISRNISIILRAERLIAQRQFAVATKRLGFYAAAGLAVGLAIVLLNIAGFFWLSGVMSKPLAAIVLAAANLLLALLFALVANSMKAGTDTSDTVELRDMALQDIETEIRDSLADARNTVSGIRRDPIGTLSPEIFSALMTALLKYARGRKDKPEN